ncbi:hypothetical protein OESDEN_21569 [Oesophagostomum dentatum]|uniref:N-acetyltransferase ESCO acetyl-transferase domain-containing protein n=1 Tax=Oesophagostomum dentatum TaxID=61180 RepID=A0A0B1S5L6_OESDE|nr:hypothetical protein OESDEN_21569 [Oesophagostomum dentatum]
MDSPGTPLFEINKLTPPYKKARLSACVNDVRQATLDAGQRKIGGQYCKQCDMLYCIDDVIEVAMHEKHHNRYTDVTRIKVSSSQLNIWLRLEYVTDPSSDFTFLLLRKECHYSTTRGYIFRVLPDSHTSLKRKAEEIIEDLVNTTVGFSPDLSIWGWDRRRTVWISILSEVNGSAHFIAGVIITEPLTSAQCSSTGKEICDGEPIIGLNRVWTHPTARRKGVASETLDVVRQRYFPGILVPKSRVAFSDPSSDGRKFAERYVGNSNGLSPSFLVYSITK